LEVLGTDHGDAGQIAGEEERGEPHRGEHAAAMKLAPPGADGPPSDEKRRRREPVEEGAGGGERRSDQLFPPVLSAALNSNFTSTGLPASTVMSWLLVPYF